MSSLNYYEVLGVPCDATQEQIKRAYRRLMKKVHPDANQDPEDKAWAETQAKLLNEAHDILSDPAERKKYDREKGKADSTDTKVAPPIPVIHFEKPLSRKLSVGAVEHLLLIVRNVGGPASKIDIGYTPENSWVKDVRVSGDTNQFVVRLSVDTTELEDGESYQGSISIALDDITVTTPLEFETEASIESIKSAAEALRHKAEEELRRLHRLYPHPPAPPRRPPTATVTPPPATPPPSGFPATPPTNTPMDEFLWRVGVVIDWGKTAASYIAVITVLGILAYLLWSSSVSTQRITGSNPSRSTTSTSPTTGPTTNIDLQYNQLLYERGLTDMFFIDCTISNQRIVAAGTTSGISQRLRAVHRFTGGENGIHHNPRQRVDSYSDAHCYRGQ